MNHPVDVASRADAARLMKHVRLLELVARRDAVSWLSGDYLTSIRGEGLVFQEARKYVAGESARLIDWNITARLGEPYVRVHHEERQREIMILLDVSPSMGLGLHQKTKLEVAVELAASLAVAATEGGDKVGFVLFADRVLAESRPRGGRKQLLRLLREMLVHAERPVRRVTHTDPRVAIHALGRYRGGRFVVFLISDLLDQDVPEDLRYLAPRHDVSLLHVHDPYEWDREAPMVFSGYSPEGESSPRTFAASDLGALELEQRRLAMAAATYRIDFQSIPTTEPVPQALERLFHRKRRRLVR